ncbi:MAG: GGDEF domain-containing protein [Candidatus Eremiobacteraeota bacterium]|nr:GGDEF domain-containing protein [Candidatus Eremiobacteraeota bacterium]
MKRTQTTPARRAWALIGAYAILALLGIADALFNQIHVGALVVIPLLLIAYYGGVPLALATGVISAVLFAALDHDIFHTGRNPQAILPIDTGILVITFLAIILLVNRFQKMTLEKALVEEEVRSLRDSVERDPLTGIPNRIAYEERLDRTIRLAHQVQRRCAVLFADLDGFKPVNDRFGHDTGDRILIMAAERLTRAVRSEDMVSRIGGDEFAAILKDVETRDEAEKIAEKMERIFETPFSYAGNAHEVGITVGVSIYPDDAGTPLDLLRDADARMYARKRAKRLTH